MFDSSKFIFSAILMLISAVSIYSQKIPSLVYDESSGLIKAIYHSFSFEEKDNCGRFKPVSGTITVSNIESEDFSDYSLELRNGNKKEVINFVFLDKFPIHIVENLKIGLLKKGSTIKVWGVACGSGSFTYASHIAKIENGNITENPPESKDSILNENPYEASKRSEDLLSEISRKITQIKDDFDKEIAPNISNEEKGEFETTDEAKARLAKLQKLRNANSSKLWNKIHKETNSLVNEYLKIVGSYYTLPIKIILGKYDADIEWFPIYFRNKELTNFFVPRKIAQNLKQNFNKANVFADYDIEAKPQRIRIEFEGQTFTDNNYSQLLEYKSVSIP